MTGAALAAAVPDDMPTGDKPMIKKFSQERCVFRRRGVVVVRELACHPKVPGSNLVRTYSFFNWPQVLHLQLPCSVITPTGEKPRINKFSQERWVV